MGKGLPGLRGRDDVNLRLHFAGEASSSSSFGLVQGAIYEGERAGNDVVDYLDAYGIPSPLVSVTGMLKRLTEKLVFRILPIMKNNYLPYSVLFSPKS